MDLARQLAAVAAVFGLLALALWALRRNGLVRMNGFARAKGGPRRIEVLERLALSPQHAVHLLKVADRALLVAVHPHGCKVLATFPSQAVPQPPESVR